MYSVIGTDTKLTEDDDDVFPPAWYQETEDFRQGETYRECIVDASGPGGTYVPYQFVLDYPPGERSGWSYKERDRREVAMGPNNPNYWDAWSTIVDQARYTDDKGRVWQLEEDVDLFITPVATGTEEA